MSSNEGTNHKDKIINEIKMIKSTYKLETRAFLIL